MNTSCFFLFLALLQSHPAVASKASPQSSQLSAELSSHPDWPTAPLRDVESPRALVLSFFSAISAPQGGTLDRNRLRSLFTPNGRVEIPSPCSGSKANDVVFMTSDRYADLSDAATAKAGFFDHLIAAHVQRFGIIANVYVAYESRRNRDDPKPFVRGVKSFELLNSAGRWYITQVAWDRERDGVLIPDALLHDSGQ